MASDLAFEVDLADWDRTVRDIEAERDDFSGKTFERYARGLFRRVIHVIPPPTVGAGKRAIRRDYASAYPRGARLRRHLMSLKRPLRAAFWAAYFRGDTRSMGEILKRGGSSLARLTISPYDMGRALRGYKRGKWGWGRRTPPALRLVTDPRAVETHIRELEGHVGKLKSALLPACKRLSIPLPAYVTGHGGQRGFFLMEINRDLKIFEWNGLGADYDVTMIMRLNKLIEDAARIHANGMRKELAGYRPEKKTRGR